MKRLKLWLLRKLWPAMAKLNAECEAKDRRIAELTKDLQYVRDRLREKLERDRPIEQLNSQLRRENAILRNDLVVAANSPARNPGRKP